LRHNKSIETEGKTMQTTHQAGDFHFVMGAKVIDLETSRVGIVEGRMERLDEVDFYLVQPDDGSEAEWLSDLILKLH
jgi:hypothetical protein